MEKIKCDACGEETKDYCLFTKNWFVLRIPVRICGSCLSAFLRNRIRGVK